MEFLFYCRDKPNVRSLLERLAEAHWSFMDRYHDRLLVRGPTLSDDGQKHTGSLHIVRLDDVAETEIFAYQEPLYKAGCYGEVIIRRWHGELDRVMRDFRPNGDDPLFLTLSTGAVPPDLPARYRYRLATYGRTLSLDGAQLTGFAAVLQAPDRAAAIALLTEAFPGAAHDLHRWRIGGRR
jgi:uncharacterized protein